MQRIPEATAMATPTSRLTFEKYLAYDNGTDTRWDTSRIPDIGVISSEQWQSMKNREAVIDFNEPAPSLVVEVMSEFAKITDYRAKRTEYSVRDIPEYRIVDPLSDKVTVCMLNEGFYDCEEFRGDDRILLPTFPNFSLTAGQILNAQF